MTDDMTPHLAALRALASMPDAQELVKLQYELDRIQREHGTRHAARALLGLPLQVIAALFAFGRGGDDPVYDEPLDGYWHPDKAGKNL